MNTNINISTMTALEMLCVPDKELNAMGKDIIEKEFGSFGVDYAVEALENKNYDMLEYMAYPNDKQFKKFEKRMKECDSKNKNFYGTDLGIMEIRDCGDEELHQKAIWLIVNAFEDLIHHEIHHFCSTFSKYEYEDFFSCGKLGVIIAMLRYDGRIDFPTFAKPYIQHELRTHKHMLLNQPISSSHYTHVQKEIIDAIECNPDHLYSDKEIEEVSRITGFSKRIVKRELYAKTASDTIELDEAMNSGYTIADDGSLSLEDEVGNKILIDKIFSELKKMEKTKEGITQLFVERFYDDLSYRKMANKHGCEPYKVEKEISDALLSLRIRLTGTKY